jgi:outer membrane receptor protein involved in Fe transport
MDWTTAVLVFALRATTLQPRITESVIVAAAPRLAGPGVTTVLDREALAASPAATLDETLRVLPGFSLFRRSSSRVANPTTQGVTLRGMAASGASRASVVADAVPLNDPFGGWVNWSFVPAASLHRVEVTRGASGDVYADSPAGTIRILSGPLGALFLAEGGADATARLSGAAGVRLPRGAYLFGAAEGFTTDGFVVVAPESRGPIDTKAWSRHASGHAGAGVMTASDWAARAKVSIFGEERGNGTPFQENATSIAHVSGGFDRVAWGGAFNVTAYATSHGYSQTFSAVSGPRVVERPTGDQDVEATSAGGTLVWGRTLAGAGVALIGSGRYVTGDLLERTFFSGRETLNATTKARQFLTSLSAQAVWHRWERVSATLGGRVESWKSERVSAPGGSTTDVFLSPRVSLNVSLGARTTARLAYQTGSRGPTMNELYRPFRVGNIVTLANAALTPEKTRSLDSSLTATHGRVVLRATAFVSTVDDAIVNVTLASDGTAITRQRRNAATIRAGGVEAEADARLTPALSLTASSAFIDSTFIDGPLDGRRVPQVPRVQAALGARAVWRGWRAAIEWRFIGRQFDDDRNEFALARSSMLDVRVGWQPRRSLELFVAIENALDEEQDVGRTPLRTIGLPRTARIGVRVGR